MLYNIDKKRKTKQTKFYSFGYLRKEYVVTLFVADGYAELKFGSELWFVNGKQFCVY